MADNGRRPRAGGSAGLYGGLVLDYTDRSRRYAMSKRTRKRKWRIRKHRANHGRRPA
ncbi:hypothetical protein T261_6118 [Streptomyces lydicus]|nr:hypothetical protein T261_6118 [Streptomyces lydicus]